MKEIKCSLWWCKLTYCLWVMWVYILYELCEWKSPLWSLEVALYPLLLTIETKIIWILHPGFLSVPSPAQCILSGAWTALWLCWDTADCSSIGTSACLPVPESVTTSAFAPYYSRHPWGQFERNNSYISGAVFVGFVFILSQILLFPRT